MLGVVISCMKTNSLSLDEIYEITVALVNFKSTLNRFNYCWKNKIKLGTKADNQAHTLLFMELDPLRVVFNQYFQT